MINTINTLELIQYKTEKAYNIIIESVLNLEDELNLNFEEDILTESASESISKFFKKIYETIKKINEQVRSSIEKIFHREVVKKQIDELEKAIDDDPSIAKEEISIKDYEQIKKLNAEIQIDILKTDSIEELANKMTKYRKQRNRLISGSVVVGTTVGTIFHFILKKKDKVVKEAQGVCKKLQTYVESLETAVKNNELYVSDPEKSDGAGNKKIKIELNKHVAAALLEVARDKITDTISETKDCISAIGKEKGLWGKIKGAFNHIPEANQNIKHGNLTRKQDIADRILEIDERVKVLQSEPETEENKRELKKLKDERKTLGYKLSFNKTSKYAKDGEDEPSENK